MKRAVVIIALVVAVSLISCHPFATVYNLYLGYCDGSYEKEKCPSAVTIDDGYGSQCIYSKQQADDPAGTKDPPRCALADDPKGGR